MKKWGVVLVVLGVGATTTPASAASLVPARVQAHAASTAAQLGERVQATDGVGDSTISGLIGICGKKRGRPYNCGLTVTAAESRSDNRGGWINSTTTCGVRLFATRRTAWFPPQWFGCPGEWNPSGPEGPQVPPQPTATPTPSSPPPCPSRPC